MRANNMLKMCSKCHRLVPYNHVCSAKRTYHRDDQQNKKIRSSSRWTKLSRLIKIRDGGIDQAAINGLDGAPYLVSSNLEVHHITPLSDDKSKAYDPNNLITLSSATHKKAESGDIDAEKLREIAIRNTKESGLF